MKKLLALLLAVLIVIGMVGCSSNNGGGSEPEPAPAEEETTDLTGKPLRILQFVSQTLGSLSCEDLVYEGIQKFCAETGSTVDTFELNYDDTHTASSLVRPVSAGQSSASLVLPCSFRQRKIPLSVSTPEASHLRRHIFS